MALRGMAGRKILHNVVFCLALSALGLVLLSRSLSPASWKTSLASKCKPVYGSWRDWNAESPECLHGFLDEETPPSRECMEDPLMCAAKALEQNSQAEDVGGAKSTAIYNGPGPANLAAYPARGPDVYPSSVSGPSQGELGRYPIAFTGEPSFIPANYRSKTPARMQELSQYYLGDHGALSSREAAKDFDSFFDSLGSNQDEKHSSRLHASVPQKHAARQQQHRRATSTMRHSVHRAASNPVQMTRAQTSHAFVPSHVANDKPNHTAQQLINRSDIKRTSSEVHTETPRQPEAPRKPVKWTRHYDPVSMRHYFIGDNGEKRWDEVNKLYFPNFSVLKAKQAWMRGRQLKMLKQASEQKAGVAKQQAQQKQEALKEAIPGMDSTLSQALLDCNSPNCKQIEGKILRKVSKRIHPQALAGSSTEVEWGGPASTRTMDKGPGDNEAGWGGPVSVRTMDAGPGDNEAGWGGPASVQTVEEGPGDNEAGWGGPASVQTMDAGPGDNEAGWGGPASVDTEMPLDQMSSGGPITQQMTQPLDSESSSGPITRQTSQPLASQSSSGPITLQTSHPSAHLSSSGPITKQTSQPLNSIGSSGPMTTEQMKGADAVKKDNGGKVVGQLNEFLSTEQRLRQEGYHFSSQPAQQALHPVVDREKIIFGQDRNLPTLDKPVKHFSTAPSTSQYKQAADSLEFFGRH